ncbi:MAG: AMP-binding protein [Acidobacteriia bacterium]|nr:AMP-binding protein [Terriglobia bacterium]
MSEAQWIWKPGQEFIERTNVFRFMTHLGIESREEFLRFSRDDPESFYDALVNEMGAEWSEPYAQVLDTSRGVEWARWFVGGKLNIAWNCLDRHAQGAAASRLAIVWEGEDGSSRKLTFAELYTEVSRLAHALESLGLQKGDRVALYMPMVPEVVVILYACFKLGIIVVPIFSGFGPRAVATRLEDSGSRVLFTADFLERRGKLLPLKEKADQACQNAAALEKVVALRYKGGEVPWNTARDVWWHDLVKNRPAERESLPLDSEDRALILYTSGTTGKPKGAGSLDHHGESLLRGYGLSVRRRVRLSPARPPLGDACAPPNHDAGHFPHGNSPADAEEPRLAAAARSHFAAAARLDRRALG